MKIKARKLLDFYVGGLVVGLMYWPVRLVGRILRRKHDLAKSRRIAFVKMLGGGSLFMMLPAIRAIREAMPEAKLSLVCSEQIAGFGRAFDVFDEIVVVDDGTLGSLVQTGFRALWWLANKVDTTVDLEIHSRLTTVLTTVSCVRNRVGLIDHSSFWRKRIYTHAVYVNPASGIYDNYDSIAVLFGATQVEVAEAQEAFIANAKSVELPKEVYAVLGLGDGRLPAGAPLVCVGVGCSDLALERQLAENDWAELLKKISGENPEAKVVFLGGKADSAIAERVIEAGGLRSSAVNLCGKLNLSQSIAVQSKASVYLGIDSALIHFARFLRIPTLGFWGPTKPETLLRPLNVPENHRYRQISCSPCVHLTEIPPCGGQNICMHHRERFENAAGFVRTMIEAGPSGVKVPVPLAMRDSEVWIFHPEGHTPVRFHVKTILA